MAKVYTVVDVLFIGYFLRKFLKNKKSGDLYIVLGLLLAGFGEYLQKISNHGKAIEIVLWIMLTLGYAYIFFKHSSKE